MAKGQRHRAEDAVLLPDGDSLTADQLDNASGEMLQSYSDLTDGKDRRFPVSPGGLDKRSPVGRTRNQPLSELRCIQRRSAPVHLLRIRQDLWRPMPHFAIQVICVRDSSMRFAPVDRTNDLLPVDRDVTLTAFPGDVLVQGLQ